MELASFSKLLGAGRAELLLSFLFSLFPFHQSRQVETPDELEGVYSPRQAGSGYLFESVTIRRGRYGKSYKVRIRQSGSRLDDFEGVFFRVGSGLQSRLFLELQPVEGYDPRTDAARAAKVSGRVLLRVEPVREGLSVAALEGGWVNDFLAYERRPRPRDADGRLLLVVETAVLSRMLERSLKDGAAYERPQLLYRQPPGAERDDPDKRLAGGG